MVRDVQLAKRNGFVLPGGLLAIYGFLGTIYLTAIRADTNECGSGAQMLVEDVCYRIWPATVAMLVVGLILIAVGLSVFRGRRADLERRLYPGTGLHMALAFVISLPALFGLLALIQRWRERGAGTEYIVEYQGVKFENVFLLDLAFLVALFILIPFVALYVHHVVQRRHFLAAVEAAAGTPAGGADPAEPASIADPRWEDVGADGMHDETYDDDMAAWKSAAGEASEGATDAYPPAHETPAPDAAAPDEVAQAEDAWSTAAAGMEPDEVESWADEPTAEAGTGDVWQDDDPQCAATTKAGAACRNRPMTGSNFCRVHAEKA